MEAAAARFVDIAGGNGRESTVVEAARDARAAAAARAAAVARVAAAAEGRVAAAGEAESMEGVTSERIPQPPDNPIRQEA